jgi:two-component system, NarL family, response regulator YdfI
VKSVVIFSSSTVLRAGLEAVVEGSNGFAVVGQAATIAELHGRLRESAPDVVVADLPGEAREAVQEILDQSPAIVIFTDAGDGSWLEDSVRLGGWAILGRDASPDKIVAAIGAAASGLVALDSEPVAMLTSAIPALRRPDGPSSESMTPREQEVLGMIAEGLGNKTIAYRLGISEHTVKFHVGSIMRKLDAASRTEAVTTGVRQGLISV